MADDDVQVLADRAGWTVVGQVATYSLGGWSASVRKAHAAVRALERWHIAIADPAGHVHYALKASTVAEAARLAEGHVRAKRAT